MSDKLNTGKESDQSLIYQVKLQGHFSPLWNEWFEGLTVTRDDYGDTLLEGPVPDQAALHGMLRKVRDLGLVLLAVNCLSAPGSGEKKSVKK